MEINLECSHLDWGVYTFGAIFRVYVYIELYILHLVLKYFKVSCSFSKYSANINFLKLSSCVFYIFLLT